MDKVEFTYKYRRYIGDYIGLFAYYNTKLNVVFASNKVIPVPTKVKLNFTRKCTQEEEKRAKLKFESFKEQNAEFVEIGYYIEVF